MNRQPGEIISCPPAPSAPPTSVSTSDVTSSSITVQWGAVDCIHRNGNITGYSVRYGVQGSGSKQTESVSGGATTEATISGLAAGTNYSIEVAAVNSAGTGVYSNLLPVLTSGELFTKCIVFNYLPPLRMYLVYSPISGGDCGLHISHHHLPLLD